MHDKIYITNLNFIGALSLNSHLPSRLTGQHPPILVAIAVTRKRLNPITDISELDHLRVEPHELHHIKVIRIRLQVVQNLDVGRERFVVPPGPREVGELVVATRRLELGGSVGGVFPNASDRVGGFEDDRVVLREVLGRRYSAYPGS